MTSSSLVLVFVVLYCIVLLLLLLFMFFRLFLVLQVNIMSGSCQGHVRVMSCQVRDMSGSCQGHVRVMSVSCQDHVRVMSGSCQGYKRVMSVGNYQYYCQFTCRLKTEGFSVLFYRKLETGAKKSKQVQNLIIHKRSLISTRSSWYSSDVTYSWAKHFDKVSLQ